MTTIKGSNYPLADYALTPDMAIIDPELVRQMPAGLTAASGIDAVTHAIEATVSVMATPYSQAMAQQSLQLLFQYLPDAYHQGANNPQAREQVHYAATLAGMAFANASLGLAHSIAHKLGEAFHIPHGVACSLTLPIVIRYNATDKPTKLVAFPQYKTPMAMERYAQLADLLQLGGKDSLQKTNALIDAINALKKRLDLPRTVREYGVEEQAFFAIIDSLAEQIFDDQCTPTNPRYPLISEIKELLVEVYG